MTDFIPSSSNCTSTPVLYIDTTAPLPDLFQFADTRVRAVRDMLKSLACMGYRSLDDEDLGSFATGCYLLLETGCDALSLCEQRLQRGEAAQ